MNTIGPSRRNQPQDGEAERGLAGAGFADDAERLALAHLDADAVDRLDVADHLAQDAALDRKPDLQVLGLDHHRRVWARRRRIGLRLGGEQLARIGMLRRGRTRARPRPARRSCRCFMTQTRSASLRTMPRSWVMNSIDMPSRVCVSLSSFRICACTVTSSAVVGSSAISRSGSLASAMAIITRWR